MANSLPVNTSKVPYVCVYTVGWSSAYSISHNYYSVCYDLYFIYCYSDARRLHEMAARKMEALYATDLLSHCEE